MTFTGSVRSSLAALQANAMDTQKIKRDGWLNDEILVITPEDAASLSAIQQQALRQIGNTLYGKVLDGKH